MPILKYPGKKHVTLEEMKKRAAGDGTPPKDAKVLTNEGASEAERFANSQQNWSRPPRAGLKTRKGR